MARPQKQGMDYFPHDVDASNDEKIDALRMLHGNDGYTFFFILLERIYRTAEFELDISDAETIQILARKVEVTVEKFSDMLQTALKRGCFCNESYEKRHVLTSPGIKKRASGVVQKRQKMAIAYQNRVSEAETPPETQVSDEFPLREKKRKGNKSKLLITPYPAAFDRFWDGYAKKTGSKSATLKEWGKLTKEDQQAAFDKIEAYKAYQPDAQYRKDPERYLKHRVWESEFDLASKPVSSSPIPTNLSTNRPQPSQAPKGLALLNQ